MQMYPVIVWMVRVSSVVAHIRNRAYGLSPSKHQITQSGVELLNNKVCISHIVDGQQGENRNIVYLKLGTLKPFLNPTCGGPASF